MTESDKADLAAMTRAFLEKGGRIVRCAEGPSETAVYRNGRRLSRAAGPGDAAEHAAAPRAGGERPPAQARHRDGDGDSDGDGDGDAE